jgi:hypothetical protein
VHKVVVLYHVSSFPTLLKSLHSGTEMRIITYTKPQKDY